MKHPYCAIGVLATSAVLCAASRAQPPEQTTVPAANPPQAIDRPQAPIDEEQEMLNRGRAERPEAVAFYFLRDFNEKSLKLAAFSVAGADWKSHDVDDLLEVVRWIESFKWHVDYNFNQTPAVVPANVEQMTVKVRVGAEDDLALGVWREEEIMLRSEIVKGVKIWRIVPEKPETLFTKNFAQSPDVGVVRRIATYLAFPKQARLWLSRRHSESQVKQIGLGWRQYSQDWDDKFPLVTTFGEQMKPYVRHESIFTAPMERENAQSYNLNPHLAGESVADIKFPAKTVAVYLGRDGKLDFRYDGQTVIGFADGHVETLDAEEAKALIWEP